AIATAQTNDIAQDTSKQKHRTTTTASHTPAQKKTSNPATSNASKTNATTPSSSSQGPQADANGPDDAGSSLSAPPGWVPPAKDAQKVAPAGQKSATSGHKAQLKKAR